MGEKNQEIPAVEGAENAPKPREAAEPTIAGKLDVADKSVSDRARRSSDAGNALDAIQRNMSAKEAWPDKIKSAWQNGADANKRKLVILETKAHEKIAELKAESSAVAKVPDVAAANPAAWTAEQKKQVGEHLKEIDAVDASFESLRTAQRALKAAGADSAEGAALAAKVDAAKQAYDSSRATMKGGEKALGDLSAVLDGGRGISRKADRDALRANMVPEAAPPMTEEASEAAPAQEPAIEKTAGATESVAPKTEAMSTKELNARVDEAINQLVTLDRADRKSVSDFVDLVPNAERPKNTSAERRAIVELLYNMVPTTEMDSNSPEAQQLVEEATWGSEGISMTIRDMEKRIPSIVGGLLSEKLTPEAKQEALSKLSALKGELKFFGQQIGDNVDAIDADSAAHVAKNIDKLTPGTTPKPEPMGESLVSDIVRGKIGNEKRKDLVRVNGETFDDVDAFTESATRDDKPSELSPGSKIDLQRTISDGPQAVARARKQLQQGLMENAVRLSAAERDQMTQEDRKLIHEKISELKGMRQFLKDTIAAKPPVIRERQKNTATEQVAVAPAEAPVPTSESNPDSLAKYLEESEAAPADSAKKITSVNRERKAEAPPAPDTSSVVDIAPAPPNAAMERAMKAEHPVKFFPYVVELANDKSIDVLKLKKQILDARDYSGPRTQEQWKAVRTLADRYDEATKLAA